MNFNFDKQGTAVDISTVLEQQQCFTPTSQTSKDLGGTLVDMMQVAELLCA